MNFFKKDIIFDLYRTCSDVIDYRHLTTKQISVIDDPNETPFARITGKSPMTIPWMNQKRMPADNERIVHRDMSLDSFSL